MQTEGKSRVTMQHNHIFVGKKFTYCISHKPKKIFTSERDQRNEKNEFN